ncbi:farnesol dehydrogenase-like [Periplaneta americana]|uniref:farnesol dehydrogenase-like n=1 Tax=Periplaneta americana TaxID=6978 RepID=UPI0037E724D6
MQRWQGRVAVVTGASAGIGAEIAKDLVKHGMKVVGIARRVERVEELKKELKGASGTLYPLQADVSKEEDVATAFKWVKDNLKGVDVLINNAGVASCSSLSEGPVKNWRTIMELNVLGLSMCTKEAIQSMKERGVDDGHIIHINSISGHGVPHNSEDLGIIFYSASKNAVTALTEGLRRELVLNKSRIKVTSLSPGTVRTEIIEASGIKIKGGLTPKQMYDQGPSLECEDISQGVLYVLGTPQHVQIHELTIKPVGEPF